MNAIFTPKYFLRGVVSENISHVYAQRTSAFLGLQCSVDPAAAKSKKRSDRSCGKGQKLDFVVKIAF